MCRVTRFESMLEKGESECSVKLVMDETAKLTEREGERDLREPREREQRESLERERVPAEQMTRERDKRKREEEDRQTTEGHRTPGGLRGS